MPKTLENPAAMASFVEKVITGDCSRYQQRFAQPKEPVVPEVIVAAEPVAEEKVVAAVPETKTEEKVVVIVAETKAEDKVIVLAFEDIHFDFDKSTLKPEAKTILDQKRPDTEGQPQFQSPRCRVCLCFRHRRVQPEIERKKGDCRPGVPH